MKNKHYYQNTATIILPLDPGILAIPNTENKVAAGTILLLNNKPAIVAHRVDMPFLGPQDGALDVSGESMEPTYPPGCKIIVCRIVDKMLLNYGECYVIVDLNFQIFVRRIYRHKALKNWVQLVCDNKDQDRYPPSTRSWEQIRALFKITSTIIKH